MQLEGLMLVVLLMVVLPLMILSSHHEVFFIIISLVLAYSSINNLFILFTNSVSDVINDFDSEADELEQLLNIDMKRFECGIKFVKGLIVLLYFIYCSFFISNIWIKIFIFTVALYKLYDIINVKETNTPIKSIPAKNFVSVFVELNILIIIVFITMNKFIFQIF